MWVLRLRKKQGTRVPLPKVVKEVPQDALARTGPDVVNHDGLRKVRLKCPHCAADTDFLSLSTVIVSQPVGEFAEVRRDFHSLMRCAACGDVVYVKSWDVDCDPDYVFSLETTFPQPPT